MTCIYTITNTVTKERYVGSAIDFEKRQRQHRNSLEKNKHCNHRLQSLCDAYGPSSFVFAVVEHVEDPKLLIEREQYWIDTSNPELNVCRCAQSSLGVKRRPETIEKVRKANLGLKHPAWRNAIKSKAMSGDKHWTKRKSYSEAAKKAMSEAQKNLYKNGYKSPRIKVVYQYSVAGDYIQEFESVTVADRITGIPYGTIQVSASFSGKRKTGGYRWSYQKCEKLPPIEKKPYTKRKKI